MADIRTRFIGSIAKLHPINGFAGFDLSAFVQRLLLFDKCTLEAFGLQEIPVLVETFGHEPLISLLKSGSFNVLFDMAAIIHWESDQTRLRRDTSGTAWVGPFIFGVGRLGRQEAINKRLQDLEGSLNLNQAQVSELREALLPKLIGFENNTGNSAIAQFKTDLSNNIPSASFAVATNAGWITGRNIDPESFSLHITQTGPDSFDVLTNIHMVHSLDDQQTIHALSGGLIALGQLNRDIEDMNQFQAMTAMRPEELPLLQQKLSFLVNQVNPTCSSSGFSVSYKSRGFQILMRAQAKELIWKSCLK